MIIASYHASSEAACSSLRASLRASSSMWSSSSFSSSSGSWGFSADFESWGFCAGFKSWASQQAWSHGASQPALSHGASLSALRHGASLQAGLGAEASCNPRYPSRIWLGLTSPRLNPSFCPAAWAGALHDDLGGTLVHPEIAGSVVWKLFSGVWAAS